MFYGGCIEPGKSIVPSSLNGGEILHISQVCLSTVKDSERTLVYVKDEHGEYCVAALKKDTQENVNVDLFIRVSDEISISTKGGQNEVHLTGYFEPDMEEEESDISDDGDDEEAFGRIGNNNKLTIEEVDESGDEATSENVKGTVKALKKGGNQANRTILGKMNEKEDDDEDDEEDEDDDDEEDDEDEDEDEEDEDEDEEEEEELPKIMKGKKQVQPKMSTMKSVPIEDKKRKADEVKSRQLNNKKVKPSANQSGDGNNAFQQSLVDYLSKHGKTSMGILGQKVNKPSTVGLKLGQFIKERKSVFKVDNGMVQLVS